jgi:hypothetical protein
LSALSNLLSTAFPKVAPNTWWSIPGGSSQLINVDHTGSNSSSPYDRQSPLGRTRKQAYGKNYSVIKKVYVRRKEMKGSSRASPLQITGSIRAKKKSASGVARTKVLGKALYFASETSDGMWRSPRISRLLDGHKAKPSSSAHPPKAPSNLSRSSPQGAHEGIFLSLFLVLLNFHL